MNRLILPAASLLALVSIAAAQADEAWTSNEGDIFWETDRSNAAGDWAVFRMNDPDHAGRPLRIFVPGLDEGRAERGDHLGYWTAYGESCWACPTRMIDAMGYVAPRWGQALVMFGESGFPSGFTAELLPCFGGEAPLTIFAEPVLGE